MRKLGDFTSNLISIVVIKISAKLSAYSAVSIINFFSTLLTNLAGFIVLILAYSRKLLPASKRKTLLMKIFTR